MSLALLYLCSGVLAGLISGMLGIGGGIVLVPILLAIFHHLAMPSDLTTHMAIGTSLATIVFTSLSAVYAQYRRQAIDWELIGRLAPATVLGSFLSGYLAGFIPGHILKSLFAVFLTLAAIQLLSNWRPAAQRSLPGTAMLWGIGTGIGALSALLGIGGGTLTVPFLNWCNVDMRRAIATSTALGSTLAIFGAMGFVVAGLHQSKLPPWSFGYISLPALLGISSSAILLAPVGVYFAHRLPVMSLKKIFGLLLLMLAFNMLWNIH